MIATPSLRPSVRTAILLALVLLLSACRVELYTGLKEDQANQMLSVLMRNGVAAEKGGDARKGLSISADERDVVRALQILREHSLPREEFRSMIDVFSGEGMIASASEERARMAYAISQELSDTFSRIDGVLTARAHVVLGVTDTVNNVRTEPSASIFLRHTPDSPVVNLVPEIRRQAANAVAGLKFFNVDVMLVPARESVTAPAPPPAPESLFSPDAMTPALALQVLALALILALLGVGAWLGARRLMARRHGADESGAGGPSA